MRPETRPIWLPILDIRK